MRIRQFSSPDDELAVVALWEVCQLTQPSNDPVSDIRRKLVHSPDLFLVAENNGEVVGTVMAGYDGHRGWINYLAVDPAHQRTGLGRSLMNEAESRLARIGCPKVNLQVRSSNRSALGFYNAIGYSAEARASFGKRLDPS